MNLNMFGAETYKSRRMELARRMGKGTALFIGHNESGINAAANVYHFRQDSSFLYYFGINLSGLAAIIDFDEQKTTLFGVEIAIDDIIWTGEIPYLRDWAKASGIEHVKDYSELKVTINSIKAKGRRINMLPFYRPDVKIDASHLLGVSLYEVENFVKSTFCQTVVDQRSIKTEEEIQEIEIGVNRTTAMHLAAMKNARPGMKEHEVLAYVQAQVNNFNSNNSFATILSVNGQVLHNHSYNNTIKEGQLLLCDCGAESDLLYAGDMTRTFPVSSSFSTKQREIYQIVLNAKNRATKYIKPGMEYKKVHLAAAVEIANGLKELGLMKGDVGDAVSKGAHALFFPHGLGHMMGLDVHDMEGIGEKYVGYDASTTRSEQFGLAFLRLGRKLEKGFVLTNEPGIYFIPQLIDQWASEKKFEEYINYSKLEQYKDFGGIRLEDDFVVTEDSCQVLGDVPPIEVEDVQEVRREALS